MKSGYSSSQTKPLFHIPGDEYKSLKELWFKSLNCENYTITPQPCVCIAHFEELYIVRHRKRQRLIPYRNNPIPSIIPGIEFAIDSVFI